MKIAILTCSVSRSAGGLLDAIRDLYKNFIKICKTDVTIYSYLEDDTMEELPLWLPLDVRLHKKDNSFYYSSDIKKALLRSDEDMLHVHGLWRYPHAFISKWKSKTGKPVIVTPHGMLDPYIIANQGSIKRIVAKFLFADKAFKNIDCYHALCKAELDAIRKYGISSPVAIIPNGINVTDNDKKFEKTDNKKHLLFLARLHPKKGVDMLIEAIGIINYSKPELLQDQIVDIVGWPQENYDIHLNKIVEKYKLNEIVKFHGGLFGDEKLKMYANADGYILPSHGEGLPMTVLEAWSWRLPVIMTKHCNIPEGFEQNAAIEISNTVEGVHEGLIRFFNMDSDSKIEMGLNGRRLVEESFTWQSSASKMEELYQWLNGSRNKPNFVNEVESYA